MTAPPVAAPPTISTPSGPCKHHPKMPGRQFCAHCQLLFCDACVTIRAQNAKGEWFERTGEDLLARAFMHETDHLHGKLYISHISALKRDLMRRKIRKLQKAGEWK